MLLLNCRIRETIRSKKPLAQSCSYCLIKHTPKKGGRRAGIVLTSYIWNNKTGFWYLACCLHTKRNRHPPRKKKKNNAFWDRLKGTHQRNFRVHRLLSCKDGLMLKKKRVQYRSLLSSRTFYWTRYLQAPSLDSTHFHVFLQQLSPKCNIYLAVGIKKHLKDYHFIKSIRMP